MPHKKIIKGQSGILVRYIYINKYNTIFTYRIDIAFELCIFVRTLGKYSICMNFQLVKNFICTPANIYYFLKNKLMHVHTNFSLKDSITYMRGLGKYI